MREPPAVKPACPQVGPSQLDHLAVVVVAEGVGRSTASVKMFTRLVSLAELAVALTEVECSEGRSQPPGQPLRRALRARR